MNWVDWERRHKTVFVHRWHNNLCRKSERIDRNLLEVINDYSKVAGYKVNEQKSVALLYIISEQVEFEIKNTVSFTLLPTKMKYLDINKTNVI